MYVSSRLKNLILATTKTRKCVTLYDKIEVVEVVLVLCCLKLNFCLASIFWQPWACILFTGLTLLLKRLSCSHSLETRESRTLSCIFSEHMPLSWFKAKFYVDSRWETRQNLTIFCVSLAVKGTCEGIFFIRVASCSLPTAILPKMNFFCKFIFLKIFDKKKYRPITFKWLVLFILFSCFHRKSLFYWNYLFWLLFYGDQSNEFASSWWALTIKRRWNTLFKWHLVKCHFDFNCCHWIVSR